jgi:hypothetical protein
MTVKGQELADIQSAFIKMLGLEGKPLEKLEILLEPMTYPVIRYSLSQRVIPDYKFFLGTDGFQLVPIPRGYTANEDGDVAIIRTHILEQAIMLLESKPEIRHLSEHIVTIFKEAIKLRYPQEEVKNGAAG